MSVHKHKNARTYSYDFQLRGVRFRGPTGATTEREARKVEARKRAEIEQGIVSPKAKKELTLRAAAHRYWEEKGQTLAAADTIFGNISNLVDGLGANKLLSQITTDDLTAYQARQKRERRGRGGGPISNRTINSEVPETISAIYRQAELWKVNLGEPINWKRLKLPLPQHRSRTASRREEIMLLRRLRPDYRPIIRFAIMSGLRKAALLLRRDQLDWDEMVLEYPKKSKHTGDKGWLPITTAMAKLLRREIEKGGNNEFVFTYLCRRGSKDHRIGERYAITENGLRRSVETAVKEAGLKDWRLMHDFRHTSATRMLRKTKNLRLVQQQLGHAGIGQTSRYAHVLIDDLRKGMEG
jgi:integrase